MVVLPVGVLFLFAYINNTLYIQVDPGVREAFICLSVDNVKNDTWPSTWRRMNLSSGLFLYNVDDYIKSSLVEYKLRLYYFNKTNVVTKEWKELYRSSTECHLYMCIILSIIFFLLFICMLGFILFKAYMYYK